MAKIFVYGTLREGMYNSETYLKGRVRNRTFGYVKGDLYQIKGVVYPALIEGNGRVLGEIMEIEGEEILSELDELETYYGEGNIDNEYDKVWMDIEDAQGAIIAHLPVYVFNMRNPKHQDMLGAQIVSGDYVAFRKEC